MSYKKGTYIALLIIISIGIMLIVLATKWNFEVSEGTVGPSYYPIGLSVLLIMLCLYSAWETWKKKEDKKIELPYIRTIFITIGVLTLFLLSWQFIGYFYINLFLATFALVVIYQPIKDFKKKLLINIVVTSMFVVFIHFLFGYIMMLQF